MITVAATINIRLLLTTSVRWTTKRNTVVRITYTELSVDRKNNISSRRLSRYGNYVIDLGDTNYIIYTDN